jgi:hypothetical protein
MRRRARIRVVETKWRTRTKTVEKPVEVVKEVPVEKIVIKEVPKEIPVNIFIYVPVPEGATEAELAEVQKKVLEKSDHLKLVS